MGIVDVKIKFLRKNGVIPCYQTPGAAGFDFRAAIDKPIIIWHNGWRIVRFGIAMEIPIGYELRIRSRSGPAFKAHVTAYHGLIDSDFRGELSVLLHNAGWRPYVIRPGQRVAQGVISKHETAVFTVVNELSPTARGTNGFGSTGLD